MKWNPERDECRNGWRVIDRDSATRFACFIWQSRCRQPNLIFQSKWRPKVSRRFLYFRIMVRKCKGGWKDAGKTRGRVVSIFPRNPDPSWVQIWVLQVRHDSTVGSYVEDHVECTAVALNPSKTCFPTDKKRHNWLDTGEKNNIFDCSYYFAWWINFADKGIQTVTELWCEV